MLKLGKICCSVLSQSFSPLSLVFTEIWPVFHFHLTHNSQVPNVVPLTFSGDSGNYTFLENLSLSEYETGCFRIFKLDMAAILDFKMAACKSNENVPCG